MLPTAHARLRDAIVRVTMRLAADGVPLPADLKAAVPDAPDFDATRDVYQTALEDAIAGYLESSGSVTRYKKEVRRAVVEAYSNAYYAGYTDAGGEDTEDEDEAWLTARMNAELGHVADLFSGLRDKRNEGGVDTNAETEARVSGYVASLDAAFQEGRLRGAKNKMLTWHLGQTEKHCATCARLDGQRHSARWWLSHNYRPREPGSPTLECGGYNCDCSLIDDDGNEVTV